MELSVMLCDDLPEERSRVRRFLQAYARERDCALRLEETASGSELLSRWQPGRWDLVLLDIYMPGPSGVETARRLREADHVCEIVFLTSSQVHGLAGYDLRILDYLVKPVDQETMFDMLDWCVQQQWERLRTLTIRSEREEMEVRLRDIRSIEVQRHTVCINLEKKVLCTRRGISELEEEIDSPCFLRCHRSFLVNLEHVKRLEKIGFRMDNGQLVPISAAKAAACRQTMMEWLLKQGRDQRLAGTGAR